MEKPRERTAVAPPQQAEIPHDLIARLEGIEAKYGHVALAQYPEVERSFVLAKGLAELRALVTEDLVNRWLMPLQGTRLGFKTDKDKTGGYQWQAVRDVFIDATLRGARMIGNEVNIIAGNLYLTKEFFERAVAEHPGVSNVEVRLGVPSSSPGGALVPVIVSYLHNGELCDSRFVAGKTESGEDFDGRIPVRINEGMGADAILGKATRKSLARVYKKLTGSNAWDGETDDEGGGADCSDKAAKFATPPPAKKCDAPAPTQDPPAGEMFSTAEEVAESGGTKKDPARFRR